MKRFLSYISIAAALAVASCNGGLAPQAPEVVVPGDTVGTVTINASVASMTMVQVGGDGTRAENPLMQEIENCMRTVTVLQFDSEGNLRRAPNGEVYRFYSYRNDLYPYGVRSFSLDVSDFYKGESTVCLVANLTEEQIRSILYPTGNVADPINLTSFQHAQMQMDYVLNTTSESEAGLVNEIYMIGYYVGTIGSQSINVALSRLVSRVQMVFSVAEDATWTEGKHLYMASQHIERYVNLWPTGVSPHIFWNETQPEKFEQNLTEGSLTVYFYIGPNSALTPDEATKIFLWYRDDANAPTSNENPDYTVYLCNGAPDMGSERNYQLNRNSYYIFNFHLTNK